MTASPHVPGGEEVRLEAHPSASNCEGENMAARKRLTVAERDAKDRMDDFVAEENVRQSQGEMHYKQILKAHQFQPGHKRMGGRKPGTPNKITTILREGVEAAAEKAGYVYVDKAGRHRATGLGGIEGYLMSLAENHPNVFARIVLIISTAEINGKVVEKPDANRVFRTIEEMKARMKERGIPIPPHLKQLEKPVQR